MTLFWIISAAMIAAALALLAPTLLRRIRAAGDNRTQFNVEIAREHLADLNRQKDAGELSNEEFDQARRDIELALAEDLGGDSASAGGEHEGGRWALLATAIVIPLITVPTYLQIGSPQLIEGLPGQAHVAPAGHGSGEIPPISELVTQLRERMEANPDNAEGWFLLGRTYMRLRDYPNAVLAFDNVVRLLPDENAALLSLADALAMQNDGRIPQRAEDLLNKVLSADPNSVMALWLLGSAAMDKGQNDVALKHWLRAHPLLANEPSSQTELGQMIQAAGGTPPAAAPTLPPIMPSQPVQTVAEPAAPAAGDAAVTVQVALAPHLMEKTAPTDTVFVLARAESGPPMPLAVSRHGVDELPLSVTLTDTMAMMPAMRLSAFPRVKISAKISKSGQAATQTGDLLASDVVVDSGANDASAQLLIDQIAE